MRNNDYFARYQLSGDWWRREHESGRYETVIRETQALIAPYVHSDPTAFCSYEDHLLAVDTLLEVCALRAESARGDSWRGFIPPLWPSRPMPRVSHVELRRGTSTTWSPPRSGRTWLWLR